MNNKYVSVRVNLVSQISRENGRSMFNNFSEMKLEYIDCIFDENYKINLSIHDTMEFKNCIFISPYGGIGEYCENCIVATQDDTSR